MFNVLIVLVCLFQKSMQVRQFINTYKSKLSLWLFKTLYWKTDDKLTQVG